MVEGILIIGTSVFMNLQSEEQNYKLQTGADSHIDYYIHGEWLLLVL